MYTFSFTANWLFILAGFFYMNSFAQTPLSNTKRTVLQKHDLSLPGREAVQVLVEFDPGLIAPKHRHPGEEIVYVAEGEFEYALDGKTPVILKKGEVLFIPAGVYHTVKNTSKGKSAELATYIVEKGKPLVEVAK